MMIETMTNKNEDVVCWPWPGAKHPPGL